MAKKITHLNLNTQIRELMIMATEATLWGLGWGFIDDAFNHFVLHRAIDTEDAIIQKYESLIRMDETWMGNIQTKARENGISVDSMIFLDAKYMADEEIKNLKK